MNKFKSISADSFDFSPFKMIGKDSMLITAEKDGKVNSMTASWGGLGVMWRKNVAYIVVRNSRYTKEFIDASNSFSLSFFEPNKYGEVLRYMGTVSGRDEDKIKGANVTVGYYEGVPYIDEASIVLVCKKMSCQTITPDSFVMDDLEEKFYKDKDYHNLYIGEIIEIMRQE
ncbi:flavin reductase [Clostridium cibarium]|uniref:Flavin reductase n=1 Tax=Clostridium cibarium TaxID=2762247 RepID=A0ABR8PYU8_9CLOT|nr:flavin reductase [Clostridium cibarium]MBD7913336.1 flavin reductase [Clostridium cibarium]